jgi:hypothetical protein
MTSILAHSGRVQNNPLDLVEEIVSSNDWSFDRTSDEEMVVELSGQWCDYNLYFGWREESRLMRFCCAFEMRVPEARRTAVHELLSMVNERMWLGHFCMYPDDHLLSFRQSVLLRGAPGMSVEQLEDMVDIAVSESERYYPAFQFVIWGGKAAHDAIAAVMLETVGEA